MDPNYSNPKYAYEPEILVIVSWSLRQRYILKHTGPYVATPIVYLKRIARLQSLHILYKGAAPSVDQPSK